MSQPVILKNLNLNGSVKTCEGLLEETPVKYVLFSIAEWNAKVGSHKIPGVTGIFGLGVLRAKVNRVLPRECTGHSKHPLPTTPETTLHMDITRWSTPKSDCSIQSAKTRPGVDCGSDHELLVAKFRLKLKKVGKTTRPLRYDLNQIPYYYTVEVTNRFKGLDLIHRGPRELWTELSDIVQEAVIKTMPRKKKCKKAKKVV